MSILKRILLLTAPVFFIVVVFTMPHNVYAIKINKEGVAIEKDVDLDVEKAYEKCVREHGGQTGPCWSILHPGENNSDSIDPVDESGVRQNNSNEASPAIQTTDRDSNRNNKISKTSRVDDANGHDDKEVTRVKRPGRVKYSNITIKSIPQSIEDGSTAEVDATENLKLFGFIPLKINVKAMVNSNMQIQSVKRSWLGSAVRIFSWGLVLD